MDAERKEMSRQANKDAVVKTWVSTPYLSHPLHAYSVLDANECGTTAQDPGVYWVPHRRRCCSKPQRSVHSQPAMPLQAIFRQLAIHIYKHLL